MSASTEGTPAWIMLLESAQSRLSKDGYTEWLLTSAQGLGVPQAVAEEQLRRLGYVKPADVAEKAKPVRKRVQK